MQGDAESALAASRALLGVVARSLGEALERVTLPQFRVLVLLASGGPQRSGDLAHRTGVHPSTFSRTADRLVAARLVRRVDNPGNRREVLVELDDDGRALVDAVTRRRLAEIDGALRRLDPDQRAQVAAGLQLFAEAAGEPAPLDLLTLGL